MFYFIESDLSILKNPEKTNKYVSKNWRSGMLAFLPANLLTKGFIILDVIGSFLMVLTGKDVGNL